MTAVQFVGAEPGAADLLTVRATRLLAEAGTVLYPGSYLDPEVLESCSPTADLIDTQKLDLDEIVACIVDGYGSGRQVVRLVSGDPTLYSAVSEQTRRLDAAGVPWEITPGVPAYAAAAARVGRELTVPLVAQSVVLTRTQARSTAMPETESLAAFASTRATLVLHLAITRTRELMEELAPAKADPIGIPDAVMVRPTVVIVFDAVKDTITVVTPVRPDPSLKAEAALNRAHERISAIVDALDRPLDKEAAGT